MNNNVFIKNKKFNPDIATNYSKKLNERTSSKFQFKNEYMNDIGVDREKINYKKDDVDDEIDKLIQKKMNERENQEFEFKPSKNFIQSSNPGDFKEYNDLKNQQSTHEVKNKKRDNDFNDILCDLKDLGILKK